jgi:tRNA(Arg) A34 adenosine deaminase TadA
MCAGAIAAYRVDRLVFGAYDPKSGAVEHGPRLFSRATTHHKPEFIGGVRDSECAALLRGFFERLRDA